MSYRMSPLQVTFHLDRGAGTSYDPYNPIHLDALLQWLLLPLHLTQHVLRRNESPAEISLPLHMTTVRGVDLWRASALFMPDDEANLPVDVRFFRKKFDTAHISEARGNVNLASGTFRDYNRAIEVRHLSSLLAYTYGNRHQIEQLLQRLPSIGSQRHRGLGRIEKVVVIEIDEDRSLTWHGAAMRWLPDPNGLREVRPRPPYWNRVGVVRCCEVGDVYEL